MSWTYDTPTQPGVYWYRDYGETIAEIKCLARITESSGLEFLAVENFCFEDCCEIRDPYESLAQFKGNGQWYGPLEVPQ